MGNINILAVIQPGIAGIYIAKPDQRHILYVSEVFFYSHNKCNIIMLSPAGQILFNNWRLNRMAIFQSEFLSAVLAIVIIDLVLAGDNAIVIGLAARNLHKNQQKKVIILGAMGAVLVRSLLTIGVIWLLKFPGLQLAGGLMLIWIAYKLLVEEQHNDNVNSGKGMLSAVTTIVLADTVMGLDNVLAVAGAAQGNFILVITGLLISIPIVVWGSTLVLKLITHYPFIIYLGSGILAFTAAKMILTEPILNNIINNTILANDTIQWSIKIVIIAGVLLSGKMQKQKQWIVSEAK